MTADCPFCRISKKELPAAIVYEDDLVIALMSNAPLRPGHIVVNPIEHFPYFDDVPEHVASRLLHVAQRLARALKAIYGLSRVAFVFTGSDIPHAHGHVVPMHEKTDITSRLYIAEQDLTFRDVPEVSLEERAVIAKRLQTALSAIDGASDKDACLCQRNIGEVERV